MEEPTNSFSDDLRRYIALAWHWAWLFIIAAVLAGSASYYVSKQTTPVYRTTTIVLVNEAPGLRSADYTSLITSERLAQTYAELMTTLPVLEGVVERLDLSDNPLSLKGLITVQPVQDTQLIRVSVEHTLPSRAASIANALVEEFAEQTRQEQASRYTSSKQNFETQLAALDQKILDTTELISALRDTEEDQLERDRLEATLAQYRQTYASLLSSYESVRLAEAQTTSTIIQKEIALTPTTPIRPQTMQNTALAAVVGLMLAAGFVFLIEALDDTIKSPEEIVEKLGLPVLGLIASHKVNGKPITTEHPRSPISEAFRAMRTNIAYASVDHPIKTIMITSPSPEDGKSTISANLAIVMAQGGSLVALIDADLRRPRVHHHLGIDNLSGLTDLMVQPEIVLNGEIQPTTIQNLVAITSGKLPPNPAEMVASSKMVKILNEVSGMADVTIVDTPPLLAVTDAAALAPRVDGVLLVIKPGLTKLAAATQAVEQLRRVGANILGVVLNDVNMKKSRYRYSYYKNYYNNYGKYYGDTASSKQEKTAKVEIVESPDN
ncbi:MAG: polysaccharide biosynthesis tyrosine autokinase [Chloroflexi bacterium]|nr:MAG: polysaccharide biosynthesis tyrosine autokinase [Chloroflexota bacterium]